MHEKKLELLWHFVHEMCLASFAMCLPGATEQTSRPFDSEVITLVS